MTIKFVIFGFIIGIIIQQGASIKCWSCRSDTDPNCGDPFNNDTLPIYDCQQVRSNYGEEHHQKPTMCRKITFTYNGSTKVWRDCAILGEVKEGELISCIEIKRKNLYMKHCYCNNTDSCNSF